MKSIITSKTTNCTLVNIRRLKKKLHRTAVFACLPLLGMSCVSQRSNSGKPDPLPPIAVSTVEGFKEESIVAYDPVEIGEKTEIAPLLAAALLPLAKETLKWINKSAWQMVGNYADKFGATYAANLSQANFIVTGAPPKAFPFVFRRTLAFKDKAEADQILGVGHLRGSSAKSKPYKVVVMEVPFVLVTSGGDAQQYSWRFIAADSPLLQGSLSSAFPTNMLYQARKAKALGVSSIDKFEVSIAVQCRISESSAAGGYTYLSDAVSASLTGDKLTQKTQKARLEGDWMPAPTGRSYSVKCTVAESSKMKDLLKKAAESGKGAVDSAVDKLTF